MTYIVHMQPGGIVARCRTPKETLKRVETLAKEGWSLEYIYDSNTDRRVGLDGLRGRICFARETARANRGSFEAEHRGWAEETDPGRADAD